MANKILKFPLTFLKPSWRYLWDARESRNLKVGSQERDVPCGDQKRQLEDQIIESQRLVTTQTTLAAENLKDFDMTGREQPTQPKMAVNEEIRALTTAITRQNEIQTIPLLSRMGMISRLAFGYERPW